jgi:hypothetical protein
MEEAMMSMFNHGTLGSLVTSTAVILGLFGANLATAQDKDALIKNALSAAPPGVAETATVMDNKGNLLREGSGAYTCFPCEGGLTATMCADAEWLAWGDAYMKQAQDYKPSGFGMAYMLAGDPPEDGASNIDPFATAATADNQWVVEGPHVMILVPDAAMLEDVSTDPDSGGPYVMWKDTPYAHIMLPTGPRPK